MGVDFRDPLGSPVKSKFEFVSNSKSKSPTPWLELEADWVSGGRVVADLVCKDFRGGRVWVGVLFLFAFVIVFFDFEGWREPSGKVSTNIFRSISDAALRESCPRCWGVKFCIAIVKQANGLLEVILVRSG